MDFNISSLGLNDDLFDTIRDSLRKTEMEDVHSCRFILLQVEERRL